MGNGKRTTSVSTMTGRERMLAAMRGEEVDRFPVWLKMSNRTWQAAQPEPYRSMSPVDLQRAAGCDLLLGCGFGPIPNRPHVSESSSVEDNRRTTVITTPDGDLVGKEAFDPYTESWHPIGYFAESAMDLARLRWYFRDTTYSLDEAKVAEAQSRQRHLADDLDAISMYFVGASPLMALVEHFCGPEATMYHTVDCPDLFAELMELMHADRMRHLQAQLPKMPADTFWLIENTSTTLISPKQFEMWCMPHLRAYGSLVLEHGIIPVHHMCGTLNKLLELIDELPAMVNEAYTTRPLGDVSLAEGRMRMPSKCLIGGTNATLWLESPEVIIETVRRDLAACPDRRRIFLTSAGVLPPPVSFAKAKAVAAELKRL